MPNACISKRSIFQDSEQISLPEDDSCLDNEDEYDALNDETFGDIECDSTVDDWEQQHEKLAQFAKHSSKEDEIGEYIVCY